MTISISDTCIILKDEKTSLLLFEKPVFPDYSNVTIRPYITYYYTKKETIWEHLYYSMDKLSFSVRRTPCLGCYALVFRRLYPLLLSTSQAKNILAYGEAADCGAYKVYQDFMTFLHKGNALTTLALSPFSMSAAADGSCFSLLYRLDTCPALRAVCDAAGKVKPGGLILLYTIKEQLPSELSPLLGQAETDRFGACCVYALTMDEALSAFVQANGSETFIQTRVEELVKRAADLRRLLQAMLAGAALPGDAWFIAVSILQQTEEILLSLYDYLENDELPVLANLLKEAILNCYAGLSSQCDLHTYQEKLAQATETFYDAMEAEFSS